MAAAPVISAMQSLSCVGCAQSFSPRTAKPRNVVSAGVVVPRGSHRVALQTRPLASSLKKETRKYEAPWVASAADGDAPASKEAADQQSSSLLPVKESEPRGPPLATIIAGFTVLVLVLSAVVSLLKGLLSLFGK